MKKNTMKYFRLFFIVLIAALLFGLEAKNRRGLTYMILFGLAGFVIFQLFLKSKKAVLLQLAKISRFIKQTQKAQPVTTAKMDITMALLCQLSHRITAKLKSAYPDAAWNWEARPHVQRLLDGEVMRIKTINTGDYNFAEIQVDSYGNIILRMMLLQSLDHDDLHEDSEMDDPEKEAPVIVDCSSWFSLLGKKALVDIIGELNCHGHSCLYIDDTGNILTKVDTEEMSCITQIPHFPGSKYYKELISLFTQAELKAVAENGNIKLSW